VADAALEESHLDYLIHLIDNKIGIKNLSSVDEFWTKGCDQFEDLTRF